MQIQDENISKGDTFFPPPLRFPKKEWTNHSISQERKKKPEYFLSRVSSCPLTSSSLGQQTRLKGVFGRRNCIYLAHPSAPSHRRRRTPQLYMELREAEPCSRAALARELYSLKSGGVLGSMCHMLKLCPPSQIYQ